jgi:hypothetical protein
VQSLSEPALVRIARSPIVVATAILACVLAGCGSEPDVVPGSFVGLELDLLSYELSDETVLLIQDVSTLVGMVPAYDGSGGDSAWIVVAACADAADVFEATAVEVAVVSAVDPPSHLDERIDDGEFDDADSCDDGRTFR